MKKLFLLFALAGLNTLPPALSAQNLLVPLLADSSHWYYYDNNGNQNNYSRALHFFNAQHLQTSSFSESTWTGSPTVYYRDTTIYDGNGNAIHETSYRSTTSPQGPWEYWIKDTLEYDAQGRVTHILAHYGSAGEWIPYYSIFYTFDDANHTESMLYLLWNTATQQWDNYNRDETIYLPDGKIAEYHRDMWDDAANAWEDVKNEYYTYRPDGLLQSVHTNEISNVETITIDSSVYNAAGVLDSSFLFTWIDDLNFQNLIIRDFNYDQNGNLSSSVSVRSPDLGTTFIAASRQFFEPGDGYYSNDYSFESQEIAQGPDNYWTNWEQYRQFTPQANGRVLYVDRYLQASPNTSLVPNTIDSVWYRTPDAVGTGVPWEAPACTCQFANPFHSGQSILCETADTRSALSYRLTDLNGRLVSAGTTLPGTPWHPVIQATGGMYLLSVWQKGVYLGSRKMVLED